MTADIKWSLTWKNEKKWNEAMKIKECNEIASPLAIFASYSKPELLIHADVMPKSFIADFMNTTCILGRKGTLHEVAN